MLIGVKRHCINPYKIIVSRTIHPHNLLSTESVYCKHVFLNLRQRKQIAIIYDINDTTVGSMLRRMYNFIGYKAKPSF